MLDEKSMVRKHFLNNVKPGIHTNDFASIYGRRAKKLGHASLATVFRLDRLTYQPILWENLESPVLRSGSCRESARGVVGTMNAARSRSDLLATVQSGRKQAQSRACTPGLSEAAVTTRSGNPFHKDTTRLQK